MWLNKLGLENVDQYYEKCGIAGKISQIQTPILFLQTADDIIVGKKYLETEINENVMCNLIVINRGNHLGTRTGQGDVVSTIAQQWFAK